MLCVIEYTLRKSIWLNWHYAWRKLYWIPCFWKTFELTHWGWVTHRCIGNLTIIGSDNGLSPGRCQAIVWTNVGILLFGPLWTDFSGILIEIHTFSFKKMPLKMLSQYVKWFITKNNHQVIYAMLHHTYQNLHHNRQFGKNRICPRSLWCP